MPAAPYLSVVVTARNDNHGDNMLARMQAFLDSWVGQANRYGIPSEIIIVEWNPPAARPKLTEALHCPPKKGVCEIRFIEVSPEIHQRFPTPEAIPLHQMIAKNVGIRRARGEFVIATNLDIVFSRELMQFLARQALQPNVLYRIDRHDVSSALPPEASLDELLDFCETHLLRVFTNEGGFNFGPGGFWNLEAHDIVKPDDGIHLGHGWHPVESDTHEFYRWMESEAEIVIERPAPALLIDVEPGPSAGGTPVSLEICDSQGDPLGSAVLDGRSLLRLQIPLRQSNLHFHTRGGHVAIDRDMRFLNLCAYGLRWDRSGSSSNRALDVLSTRCGTDWSKTMQAPSPFAANIRKAAFLHTNGCGDFTLLSRHDWFKLRGYAEFPIWPMHIDSLLCYSAYHAGIEEIVLEEPMRIFHIEHLTGAGWTPEGELERQARIEAKGVPVISYPDLVKWVDRMRRFNRPIIFTKSNWGLASEQLPETIAEPH